MTIPATITIGPHLYTVESDKLTSALLTVVERYGETSLSRLSIRIDPEYPPSKVRETLLHEVLHTVFDAMAVTKTEEPMSLELEEWLVSSLAPWLLMVLRDNTDLVDFLLADG